MTAGTDPEPAEPSRAIKMPSIMQISHIPYLDHNYGQPPPMTPPDSNSPGPDDLDTGNEEDEGNAVTRCICGFDHDDGYMICCDKCSVWQHIECMGISSESLPDNYLCEQCEPRLLDRERAKGIQMKKKEEMSDDDDDDDESGEEADGTTYTAFSNTPTRITLTAKVSHTKRKNVGIKMKGEREKEKKTKRRKRKEYSKQRIPTEFIPVDEETNGPWENSCNRVDYYQEAKECTYTSSMEEFMAKLAQTNHVRCIADGIEQFCKVVEVQKNTKGLVATEDLYKDQFLIKFKGKMMFGSEFDEENPMFRRYIPFVIFYQCMDFPKICVDARVFGNEARFIRRSCSPNAEVRHVLQNGRLYLAVFSLNPLPKGAEITIPFEFQFADYHCSLSCACAQDTCAVAKYKLKCQVSGQELNSIAEQNGHRLCDDSSNSSHNPLMASPLRAAMSSQNSVQGDSDSDADNTFDKSNDGESRRKKLSREERKLEAYVKQIEKMEKKEKKRQQPQKEHRQVIRVSSDEGVKPHIKGIRCPKRLNHKRRSNGTSSLKKKRARVSSCSSEPLSPDEVSSSASTPTTPKPVATIPEESPNETPSTSPSRNFRFPKGKMDENSQDAVITSTLSSPTSPCSPRESETDIKPTLSTASSNSDIAMAIEMEESEAGRFEESCDNSLNHQRDISRDLSVRLAEISNVSRSECNTPSPCPSSSASPTSSESVMNGCPSITFSGARSPGPAPGSPLAAMLHGVRSTRTNPLYCSLKKRWLYKFLNSQNGVGVGRPVNGVRNLTFPDKPKVTTLVNLKPTATYKEPLPLKKRYLRIANSNTTTKIPVSHPVANAVVTTIESKPNEAFTSQTNSTNETNKFMKSGLERQFSRSPTVAQTDSRTIRTISETRALSPAGLFRPVESSSQQACISKGTIDTTPDIKPVIISTTAIQRTSDPRQQSPSSSIQATSIAQSTTVTSTPASSVTQSSDVSSGTPGKKKVSLLEYRNRSLQRLSGDGPKPSSISTTSTTLTTSSTPTKPSSTSNSTSNHQINKTDSTNGPSVEPVSPDEDERYPANRLKMNKVAHSPLYEAELNSIRVRKKEVGVSLYQKKIAALISEQLMSDPSNSPSSSKSPSTASSSPSIPPPPPPPPSDTAGKGDAMEIEEEDGPNDQKIFVTTPIVQSSRPSMQTHSQPSLMADYRHPHHPHQMPDYRLHDHHPHVQSSILAPMISPSSTQLPSPMSAQPRVSASPYHLNQAIPSQIRFPASYQNPSLPNAPYYQQ